MRLAFDWAQLKPGERVLIHAASGGVGLAAIQMAQQCTATVYATASTFKRATLRKLGVKYFYDLCTTDFADWMRMIASPMACEASETSEALAAWPNGSAAAPSRSICAPRCPSKVR